MERNSRFLPNYHSFVNRNNIAVPLNDSTDQHNQQGNSSSSSDIPPLLPPPPPPQIPSELLGNRPPSTEQINNTNDGHDGSERESVEEAQHQLSEKQPLITLKDVGEVFARYYNYCENLKKELAEEKKKSESLQNEKSVSEELLKSAQAEISIQGKKIEELNKVNEQQKIWEIKYEKLNETYTSAKNELQDKNNRIKNLGQVNHQIQGQLGDCKNKIKNFEVSDRKLRQELKEKSKECSNLESNYNAKCTELKGKIEDIKKLEGKYNTKCAELKTKGEEFIEMENKYTTKLRKIKADLKEKIKINTRMKEINEQLKVKKYNLSKMISKKDDKMLKLSGEVNSIKQDHQNITSETNTLYNTLSNLFPTIRQKYNIPNQPETEVSNIVVQEPVEKFKTNSNLVNKENAGEDESDNVNVITNTPERIENDSVDHCDSSDGVNEDEWTLPKISLTEPPMPLMETPRHSNETPKCREPSKRKTPEADCKEPDPVDDSCANNGNPRIILKISKKLKIERNS